MAYIRASLRLLVLLVTVQYCCGYKIIMLSPFGSKSHLNNFYTMGEALVAKGHEVTIVAGQLPHNGTKIREVYIKSASEGFNNSPSELATLLQVLDDSNSKQDDGSSSNFHLWNILLHTIPNLCEVLLTEEKEMIDILNGGIQYDLAINNYIFNECTLPLAFKVAKHVVLSGGASLMNNVAYDLNIPHPLSTNPSVMLGLPLNEPMTFRTRAINAGMGLVLLALERLFIFPANEKVIRAHYSDAMSIVESMNKVSLLLVNRVGATEGAVPSVPYMVEIGGMHTRPAKPLPKEFEEFIKGSGEAGFVFVSFGSVMPEELIPEDKIRIFIEAFGKLPYRVIWKYKKPRSDIPSNVMTTKWAPQQDILGHPKCRAFVSHGGHSSLDESVYHGVPILGMPLFADQPSNIARSMISGFAVQLLWSEFSVDSLLQKLNQIVSNPSYKERAQSVSALMRDQPEPPLERAVFWLEYVIRHDGAAHLRTAADHLNLLQYFLLDVMAAALALLCSVIYVTYRLTRLIVCVACCGKRSKSPQHDKNKKVKKN